MGRCQRQRRAPQRLSIDSRREFKHFDSLRVLWHAPERRVRVAIVAVTGVFRVQLCHTHNNDRFTSAQAALCAGRRHVAGVGNRAAATAFHRSKNTATPPLPCWCSLQPWCSTPGCRCRSSGRKCQMQQLLPGMPPRSRTPPGEQAGPAKRGAKHFTGRIRQRHHHHLRSSPVQPQPRAIRRRIAHSHTHTHTCT